MIQEMTVVSKMVCPLLESLSLLILPVVTHIRINLMINFPWKTLLIEIMIMS